ncbi:hypothetical protein K6Y76_29290 [Burkholderia cenocepacia]|uniref:hypothetical protein n=1 Tax=Burkholderia cenocepacia TaxID=95486 RepID=UPI000ADB7BE1|nr:hypothetical protein [Burkholderia cenocepacia]MCG0579240.1 hypothetical protein [Burkholderia cenocepacia]MCW3527186.1 hypothetical protein [Burkholderia cenocepacia]MCW3617151.1 hypothetical protein [Burkholderia cenocepacia]MCW3655047.1 hypothetical protein [Burkholderia cenocepacia]MCW3669817.1 hypothetical protein [Burkholderia cenocepacia]
MSWLLDIHNAFTHYRSREHAPHRLRYSGKSLSDKAFGLIRTSECMMLTCPTHSDSTGWACGLSTYGLSTRARNPMHVPHARFSWLASFHPVVPGS